MPTTANAPRHTVGALELSQRDAESLTRILPSFATLTDEQGVALRNAGKLGLMLMAAETTATWAVLEADRAAGERATEVKGYAGRVIANLAGGYQEDGSLVESATGRLVEALAERKAGVEKLLANRRIIDLLLGATD